MKRYAILFFVLLVFGVKQQLVGQTSREQVLNPGWVENDVQGLKFLIGLMPIESHDLSNLRKQFDTEAPYRYTSWLDHENLGFGAQRAKLSMGLGYTTIYIDFLLFRDQIVHYKVGARIGGDRKHVDRIALAWKDFGGPPFVTKESELTYEKDFSALWSAYYSEIEKQVGALKEVNVPESLRSAYTLLTNPLVNSRISMVARDDGKPGSTHWRMQNGLT